jgi:cytochrome bd-type quinol oxidase subunit 2
LVSFASARALNALISVAQETEIAIEPAGVGVTLAPGQILDPLNDLVERFGDLMLGASIAFGVQKLLISIGASWVLSLILTIVAAATIILLWRGKENAEPAPIPAWMLRLLTALIVVRFALPVVTIGNELLFQAFLAKDYKQGQEAVTLWTDKAENMAAAPQAKQNTSTYENFKAWLAQNVNIRERLDRFRASAEQTTEHVIKLMAIFLVQTVLAPLAFLWLLMRGARQLLDPRQWGRTGSGAT